MFNKKSNEKSETKVENKYYMYSDLAWSDTILFAALEGIIDTETQSKIYEIHRRLMDSIVETVLKD